MADNTYTLEIIAKGLKEVTKGLDQLNAQQRELEGSTTRATKAGKRQSLGAIEQTKQNKGVEQAGLSSSKAFSKMANNMQGTLVPAYATVAANVFALTAAFGALERAADFSILVDSAKSLATQTGRSLITLSEGMQEVTGSAISMKEALTSASIAASAGFDNDTILKLTQVARNASVALGREMTDSLNRVFKGAIKAEPELLDELGIILRLDTAARKYAATLGKTAQELSTFEKQQAVVNDVIEQGEKKFGRLSEVDPNPYTQLAAAFHDITTELINLVGLPIGDAFSFLADNVTALGALLLLFATRIVKFAFPALNRLSETIEGKLATSMERLKVKITAINNQKLNIINDADVSRTNKTLERMNSVIDDSVLGLSQMGRTGSAAFTRLENEVGTTKQQLLGFKKVYSATLTQLKAGVTSNGLAATSANIRSVESALKRVNIELDLMRGKANKSIFTSFVGGITNARLAVAGFSSEVQKASLQATKMVNESTLGFTGLASAIYTTWGATTGLTRAFSVMGAVASGAMALIFKAMGPIFAIVLAWELLGSAISAVYEYFAGSPEAVLSDTLAGLEGQLEDVTSASINYRENMDDLPDTMENVTDKVHLQANALSELNNVLKETNNDLKLLEGFGLVDELLGSVGFGDISTLEEQTEQIVKNLTNLGKLDEVNKLIEDFGDVSDLSGAQLIKYNAELGKITNELNTVAAGSKNAIDSINEDIIELGKNLTSLSIGFGKLSEAEKIYFGLNSIIDAFDAISASALTMGTAINNLSTTEISMLGIEDEVMQATKLDVKLKALLDKRASLTAEVKAAKEASGGAFDTDVIFALEDLERIEVKLAEAKATGEDFGETLKIAMKKGADSFQVFINATKAYNAEKQRIKVEDLLDLGTTDSFVAILNQSMRNEMDFLQASTNVIEANKKNQQASLDAAKARSKLALDTKTEAIAKGDDTAIDKAENALATAKAAEGEFQKSVRRLENALLDAKVKGTEFLIKDVTKLQKRFETLSKTQLFTSNVYTDDVNNLRRLMVDRLTNIAITLDTDEARESVAIFIEELDDHKTYDIELALLGIDDVKTVVAGVNKLMAETLAMGRETSAIGDISTQDSFRVDYENLIREKIAMDQLAYLVNKNLSELAADDEKEHLQLIAAKREEINVIQQNAIATTAKSLAKELISVRKKLLLLGKEAKHGAFLNKLDKQGLEIAKLRDKFSNSEDLSELIRDQKELNKLQNNADYENSLRGAAEAMNELADATNTFFDNLQDGQFDDMTASLMLLQEIGENIDGPMGQMTKGFATLGVATQNYAKQMDKLQKMKITEEFTEQDRSLKSTQATVGLLANSAGALAGMFEEGSSAAKAFTIVQQGLAVASAAVAVMQAAALPPPAGIASAAAMLALVTSVLGLFGVGTGGSGVGTTGKTTAEQYRDEVGSQGLVGRDLLSNTLIDGTSELISINTKMYGATRDLEITMGKMAKIFDNLAATLFNSVGTTRGVSGFANTEGSVTDVTSGAGQVGVDIGNAISDFAVFLGGGSILGTLGLDKLGGAIGDLFGNSTSVSRELIDAGLQFNVALQSVGDSIVGSLNAVAFSVVEVTSRTSHTFHSDSVSRWIEDDLHALDVGVQRAFADAFDDIIMGISSLVTEFSNNAAGIDLVRLFSGIDTLDAGPRLSLLDDAGDPLDEEGTADAIAAYFSSLTADMAGAILPFLDDFRLAGEELGDTLIRLTTDSIKVNAALSTIGTSIQDYTNVSIDSGALNEVIAAGYSLSNSDINDIRSYMTTVHNAGGGIWSELIKGFAKIAFTDSASNSEIYKAMLAAAESFKVEAVAAWDEALLSQFKDADEFNEIFVTFAETIFDDAEMAGFAIENATKSLGTGFDDLIDQAIAMGRGDLAAILQEGITPESLRKFYELADATGAFAVAADFATGEINTAGADLLGTAVAMGPAFAALADAQDILDDLVDAIEDLNGQYVEQILLFGKLGKEAKLLSLAFDFDDALAEAKETGSDIALVEYAFGLERLAIIKDHYQQINDEIEDVMGNILDSVIEVSRNSDVWDEIAFSIVKINKLVTQLSKGVNTIDLSSLVGDSEGLDDFVANFQDIIDAISEDGPGSISEEIGLVDELRASIVDRYALELQFLEEQKDAYQDLSTEIRGYLDNLLLSDASPLTNFERLTEAESQFLTNAANVFSEDEKIAAIATENLLASADNFLEAASGFWAIGPEYQKVFDLVTTTLGGIDAELLVKKDATVEAIDKLNTDTLAQLSVLDDVLAELKLISASDLDNDIASAITEGMLDVKNGIIDTLTGIDDGSWTTIINTLGRIEDASYGNVLTVSTPTADYDANDLTGIIEATTTAVTDMIPDVVTAPVDTTTPYVAPPPPEPVATPPPAPEYVLPPSDQWIPVYESDAFNDTLVGYNDGSGTAVPDEFLNWGGDDAFNDPYIIPEYVGGATGSYNIPEDMTANIHQGEVLVPNSFADGLRNGTLTLGEVQDNSDVVEAIRELTGVLAVSQEDIVDAANRNVQVSKEIANTMSGSRQPVGTSGVL